MTHSESNRSGTGFTEFVALMALMMSTVALSIDGMLPALPAIGQDLGVSGENDTQLIVSFIILGLAIGQMLYGPLSDSIGRKPAIYIGYGLFIIGCLISIITTDFTMMLVGRVLQGVGAAGPRTVTLAIIRDQYEGRSMARVMSFVMTVFILVPAIAPSLGQAILIIANWRAIFGAFLGLAAIAIIWFVARQPETLSLEHRRPLSLSRIISAIREICLNRIALGYTLTTGFVFSGFLGYLSSTQQIFQEVYHVGTQFPLYFGVIALALGSASFVNGQLVMRYGMHWLTSRAIYTLSLLSILFFALAFSYGGQPPLWLLMAYFMLIFFCVGLLFGNLNALAMAPLGHIAGIGAGVIGSLSTLISVPSGILIGQSFNGTVLPLVGGFAFFGVMAAITMNWAEAKTG